MTNKSGEFRGKQDDACYRLYQRAQEAGLPLPAGLLGQSISRAREVLQEAIIEALPRITAQDALGWFLHCGYLALEAGDIAQQL